MVILGTSKNVGHAWNIVQLQDGQWYEIDCTWDDGNKISYDYFLLTTEQMNKDHSRNEEIKWSDGSSSFPNKDVPTAYGTEYAYVEKPEYKKNAYHGFDAGGAHFRTNVVDGTCTLINLPQNKRKYTIPDTLTYDGHELIVDTIDTS